MSLRYRNNSGEETIIAGLTPGGDIEAGAIATRTGTKQIIVSANSSIGVQITFSDPMPDADYDVNIEITDAPLSGLIGGLLIMPVNTNTKTANGFEIAAYNNTSSSLTVTVSYKATKTYTVQHAQQNAESIATLEAMVPTGAGAGNKLVTASQLTNTTTPISNAVADIQDLIPVGASVSNQLVTKSEASIDSALSLASEHAVQNKVVTAALDGKQDTLTFDTVPTLGSTHPVTSNGIKAELDTKQGLIFKGTKAQWNALSTEQKTSYTFCVLTDDTDYNDNIVDSVTNGNMYAVTSNAVYDYIQAALANFITIKTVTLGDITVPSSGYIQITSFLPTPPAGKSLRFVQVYNYGQGGGAISVDTRGSYISGTPNKTYTSVTLSYFYW